MVGSYPWLLKSKGVFFVYIDIPREIWKTEVMENLWSNRGYVDNTNINHVNNKYRYQIASIYNKNNAKK